jgi:hypothetical protein
MIYKNQQYDEERALYDISDSQIINCVFDGEADGESALKECSNITVDGCDFRLRYPLWHVRGAKISDSSMSETCRAALWYCEDLDISNCHMYGIKALRECCKVRIEDCDIDSAEFGWRCRDVSVEKSKINAQYLFFECRDMNISELEMSGKYSFQYVENLTIRNSVLNTKDAFWHAKNVTVEDSIIVGEYLAWYSENLTLIRCKIVGTQPLCYCRGLVMRDCVMENTDLSFENSDVDVTVKGEIMSVKNPMSGRIRSDGIGELIWDEKHKQRSTCTLEKIIERSPNL